MIKGIPDAADLFSNVSALLLEQVLGDGAIEDIVQAVASCLVESGLPVARQSIGRSILHLTIGLTDMTWERETDQASVQTVPRSVVRDGLERDTALIGSTGVAEPRTLVTYPLF